MNLIKNTFLVIFCKRIYFNFRKTKYIMNISEAKEVLGEGFQRDADFITKILDTLVLSPKQRILDIGTGRGFMAIHLALKGLNVESGEPEKDNWADWRTNAKMVKVQNKIHFTPFSATAIPFENDFFDYVFLSNSFHHIDEKQKALNEINRVLKDSGKIVILEFNKKGVERVRSQRPNHPDAVDPLTIPVDFEVTSEIIEEEFSNAYIFTVHK
ncbi:2-methoxy-6-polyprenyl-1,4-benzoquinol methylase, mitochondrial [Candidatus Lokiarchaeum ossiferum]|uniref:2-methoxy-6-polyprenyl-1,4-benzoquinol methylase, mitochondrial n=1 Tax=Candidatus Lokiarchaeum ossiferum TaxID=2951803 RepID=A0ABY6HYM5_9ARCH|nr:2-methoxy-6-polyprenyl-1,4-benzoquinol methylase, mitochondrial [Candidatus Lokiarchaeum sp. B-35]